MAFTEFFNKEARKEVYGRNMEILGRTRDSFLEMLVENGVERTLGLREVFYGEGFFGDDAGANRWRRKTTTVKLATAGDWVGENNIQVEIFTRVAKNKLQQLQHTNKKPTVHAILTFDDEETRYVIPNDVTDSYAYEIEEGIETEVGNESFCVGLAEVMEYFQAGKLTVVKE